MGASIYYFSGTGNSYSVAKGIAERLGGALVSIAAARRDGIVSCPSSSIGIVFPRYYGYEIGVPLLVKDFVTRLEGMEGKYVFAVCTYGGGFGDALEIIDGLLKKRGGKLSSGFGIHMPQNAFLKPWARDERLIRRSYRECARICESVKHADYFKLEKPNFAFKAITGAFVPLFRKLIRGSMAKCAGTSADLPFEEIVARADRSFSVGAGCDGCGVCQRVCPVGNIVLIDKRPVWQNRCENCLACHNWCPRASIRGGIMANNYHYHNPDVRLAEMLQR